MTPVDEGREGDRDLDAIWAATSPKSGRFDPIETTSSVAVLRGRLAELEARGAGYFEVRRVGEEFPLLTLGFRGSLAVVHAFKSVDHVELLSGAGALSSAAISVPVLDDAATFDSWAGNDLRSAWELVEAFTRGGELEVLGAWVEL
jgi:hypothetical protein